MKASVDFKQYSSTEVLNFVCDNYSSLGRGQSMYTCAVALQYLFNTGRLDSKEYNFIKNAKGDTIVKIIERMIVKDKLGMFAYNQNHYETEWNIFLNKKFKKS
jgi:hypothetical protein